MTARAIIRMSSRAQGVTFSVPPFAYLVAGGDPSARPRSRGPLLPTSVPVLIFAAFRKRRSRGFR